MSAVSGTAMEDSRESDVLNPVMHCDNGNNIFSWDGAAMRLYWYTDRSSDRELMRSDKLTLEREQRLEGL